ncbi:MAG: UDP-3-O-(3-hydroxymyristoyl)glucosamine N-acyltransferase [Planctomycetota bacterium]
MTPSSPAATSITLAELAALVGGTVRGDGSVAITGAAPLGDVSAGQITLVDHADRLNALAASSATAVVLPADIETSLLPSIGVSDLHEAFTAIVKHFRPQRQQTRLGKHPSAVIAASATIAENVEISPGVVIGEGVEIAAGVTLHPGVVVMAGCRIGAGTTIFPNATLYEETQIGARCLVHASAVIGAYGFGYSQVEGRHVLASQLGNVELGDDVEVGAGTTIDRGVYGPTRIGEGTKIDNLAQIAHNCQIGRHNLICSQVGIAGSTTTGDYVVMAGQAGVRDHVTIGAGAQLGAMCGVSNDVAAGESVLGAPAVPVRDQRLRFAAIAKLPEMRKEFKAMRKQVKQLEDQLASLEDTETEVNDRAA